MFVYGISRFGVDASWERAGRVGAQDAFLADLIKPVAIAIRPVVFAEPGARWGCEVELLPGRTRVEPADRKADRRLVIGRNIPDQPESGSDNCRVEHVVLTRECAGRRPRAAEELLLGQEPVPIFNAYSQPAP